MASTMTFALIIIEHPLSGGEHRKFCLVHEIENRLYPTMLAFEILVNVGCIPESAS